MVPQQLQLNWGMFTSFACYKKDVSIGGLELTSKGDTAMRTPPNRRIAISRTMAVHLHPLHNNKET